MTNQNPYKSYVVNDHFTIAGDMPDSVTIFGYSDPSNDYIPKKNDNYVFRKEDFRDLRNFLQTPDGDAMYIAGPTGSGKTSVVTQMASRLAWPVQQITAHSRLEMTDLVGFHSLTSSAPGEIPTMQFQYGPLSIAMREGHILLINEIDMVDPGELAGLNDVLEGAPLVIAANGGEIIKPHPMFRVVVTANSFGSGDSTGLYQGVSIQNAASLDRYRFMSVGYADADVELSILNSAVPAVQKNIKLGMIKIANEVRRLFIGNNDEGSMLSITLSTRTLIRWCKITGQFRNAPNPLEYGLDQALLLRASSVEKEAVLRIAKDIFGDLWS